MLKYVAAVFLFFIATAAFVNGFWFGKKMSAKGAEQRQWEESNTLKHPLAVLQDGQVPNWISDPIGPGILVIDMRLKDRLT